MSACDREDTESPDFRRYGAQPFEGVDMPIEADTHHWDWKGRDVDRDEILGREEFERGLDDVFERLDRDGDGVLTPVELERKFDPRRLEELNIDGRPGLSREELGRGWFDALDVDASGFLEPNEWPKPPAS